MRLIGKSLLELTVVFCSPLLAVPSSSQGAPPPQANGYILQTTGQSGTVGGFNNNGQILINDDAAGGDEIYTPGTPVTNIGTLPAPFNSQTTGRALNNAGQAVGTAFSTASGYQAFLYSGGTMHGLGTLPGFGSSSEADGINNAGQVVGNSVSSSSNTAHAFIYSNGFMTDAGSLPGYSTSIATSINNTGESAGYCYPNGFEAQPASMAYISGPSGMQALGRLPGPYNYASFAFAMNDHGDVVGSSEDSAGNSHAVLWSNGNIVDLGTLPGCVTSTATGINSSGQIIGYSSDSIGATRFFLYANGTMTDLNGLLGAAFGSKFQLGSFDAINDSGQIAATGYQNGIFVVFELTPVPEPTCLCLVALGSIRLLRRTRVRRV